MSFSLLSTTGVLAGIALLSLLLWLAQRLRVQHREVQVLSTLFWQAAIEETRARVLVRRFRHWPAWVLLVAIASLLWLLLATPQRDSLDGTQHVVVVDWSIEDEAIRSHDMELAIAAASSLPDNAREIVAVGSEMQTLLAAGESIDFAEIRAHTNPAQIGSPGMGWAIDSLSARASQRQPLAIHIVGDPILSRERLSELGDFVSVDRIARDESVSRLDLQTLGLADAASGRWDAVDVWFAISGSKSTDPKRISVTINDAPIVQSVSMREPNSFELSDILADGSVLSVQVDGKELGSLTLPSRKPIRVSLDENVPASLRQLVALDSACDVVSENADIKIGLGSDCNFRLSADDETAFLIDSPSADPQKTLSQLVDELALRQIDATSIAEQSGLIIDVQVKSSVQRRIAVWRSLFSSAFDFQESRACPIFVSRSIRWLANRPPIVPWAAQGERLPVAAREFDRITSTTAVTSDGRTVLATRVGAAVDEATELPIIASPNPLTRFSLTSWLGLIVIGLLIGEWALYQRGQIP